MRGAHAEHRPQNARPSVFDFINPTLSEVGLKIEMIFLFGSSFDCGLSYFRAYSFQVFRYTINNFLLNIGSFFTNFWPASEA